MKRPSGLKYNIKVKNKGWFKTGKDERAFVPEKGTRMSPETEFKKGARASVATEFKTGQISHNFKGDAVGYHALHVWLRRNYGSPLACEKCGSTINVEWASKDWTYSRTRESWWALCRRCHTRYDMDNAWGVATTLYPELRQ